MSADIYLRSQPLPGDIRIGPSAPDAVGFTAYALTGDTGIFLSAGTAALPAVARQLVETTGLFIGTGSAAIPKVARQVSAAAGLFTLAGRQTTAQVAFQFSTSRGIFAVHGIDANTVLALSGHFVYVLSANTGQFAFQAATLKTKLDWHAFSNPGLFSVTGKRGIVGRGMAAASGIFNLQPAPLAHQVSRLLRASAGLFVQTGSNAQVRSERHLALAAGLFNLTGQPVIAGFGLPAATGFFHALPRVLQPTVARFLHGDTGIFRELSEEELLAVHWYLHAGTGIFLEQGVSATSTLAWKLRLDPGLFTIETHYWKPPNADAVLIWDFPEEAVAKVIAPARGAPNAVLAWQPPDADELVVRAPATVPQLDAILSWQGPEVELAKDVPPKQSPKRARGAVLTYHSELCD